MHHKTHRKTPAPHTTQAAKPVHIHTIRTHPVHIAKAKPIHIAKPKPIHIAKPKPIHFKKPKPLHLGKEIKQFGKDLGIGNAFKGLEDIAKGFSPLGLGKELSGALKGIGGKGLPGIGDKLLIGAGVVGGVILIVIVGGYAFKSNGSGGGGRVK